MYGNIECLMQDERFVKTHYYLIELWVYLIKTPKIYVCHHSKVDFWSVCIGK